MKKIFGILSLCVLFFCAPGCSSRDLDFSGSWAACGDGYAVVMECAGRDVRLDLYLREDAPWGAGWYVARSDTGTVDGKGHVSFTSIYRCEAGMAYSGAEIPELEYEPLVHGQPLKLAWGKGGVQMGCGMYGMDFQAAGLRCPGDILLLPPSDAGGDSPLSLAYDLGAVRLELGDVPHGCVSACPGYSLALSAGDGPGYMLSFTVPGRRPCVFEYGASGELLHGPDGDAYRQSGLDAGCAFFGKSRLHYDRGLGAFVLEYRDGSYLFR